MARIVTLSVHSANDLQNKVAAIKGVRTLTGHGLKDSKDLVERINPGRREVITVGHDVLEPHYSECLNSIRSSGLTVVQSDPDCKIRKGIGEEIRRLITYTTMAGQYDISKSLLDVLETYCPAPSDDFKLESDDDNENKDKTEEQDYAD